MSNYIIVLFKNRKKRKIIKRYSTEKKALDYFSEIIRNNSNVILEKKIENASHVEYHIGLLSNQTNVQNTLYFVDELGRNHLANLQNKDYVFLKLEKFKLEETIYDYQDKSKISFQVFLKKYCDNKEMKNIFSLNNKICVQINEEVFLFSLKDVGESSRFLNILEKHFYNNSRTDAIFVRDVSLAQRKWVYEILTEKGYSKRNLYRQKTTFSKR